MAAAYFTHLIECKLKHDQCRSNAERDHIGETVILGTEITLGIGPARNPSIQPIHQHGEKYRVGSPVKPTLVGGDNGKKAGAQGTGCQGVGEKINTAAAGFLDRFVHGQSVGAKCVSLNIVRIQCISSPMRSLPACIRSPILRSVRERFGRYTSICVPSGIKPQRLP